MLMLTKHSMNLLKSMLNMRNLHEELLMKDLHVLISDWKHQLLLTPISLKFFIPPKSICLRIGD